MTIPIKKNVLYISYDGMTDSLGQSQVISYLKGLSEKHYSFTIISFEKEDSFVKRGNEIKATLNEYNISWINLAYTKKPPVISTIIDLLKMKQKAVQLYKINNYEIVHCRSYISSLVGLYLKSINAGRIKFVFDMRGFWIEERLDGQMWNLKNPLYKIVYSFFKSKEKLFYEKADKIIILTNAAKKFIVKEKGVDPAKIGVVPTCVDFNLFKITSIDDRTKLRNDLNIKKDARIFIYAGAISGSYNIDLIIKVYYYYKLFFDNTHLLLLAKDPLSNTGLALLDELNIDKSEVSIVESPFNNVYEYLNIGHLGFVFYSSGWSNIARSPTKMGEYLACELPTLVYGSIGDIDELKDELEVFVLDEITKENCFELFEKLAKSQKVGQDIRDEAFEYCSLEKGVEFYHSIYKELTPSHS